MLKINFEFAGQHANESIKCYEEKVKYAYKMLHDKEGQFSQTTGWLDLPADYDKIEFERIKNAAKKIQADSDILVVLGIGGSYLGAKSAIEFLFSQFYNELYCKTKILFAGNNFSASHLNNILKMCEGKEISVNVISKSGTTTETSVAFRVMKEYMEKRYKSEAKNRIYVTTDSEKGILKKIAVENGYDTYVIPNNIGGRYSVLTAVGLLPVAVSGADIDKLMRGAYDSFKDYNNINFENDCYKYAVMRNILYHLGKQIEVFASYEPNMISFGEWLKQLFGESEGKDNKGLFPMSLCLTTDLHSLGQYMQEGKRDMFETVLWIDKTDSDITLKAAKNDFDGLNFLNGVTLSQINKNACMATVLAHYDADVPNIIMQIDKDDEYSLGYLIYFFEYACAISALLLEVNPFNQPGVESYKQNMFALLGKNGFEEKSKSLKERLNKF